MLGTLTSKTGSTVITNFNRVSENDRVHCGYFDGEPYSARNFYKKTWTFTASVPKFESGQVAFLSGYVPAVRTGDNWVHVNESGATMVTRTDEWVWKKHLETVAAGRRSIITDTTGRELHR